MNLYRKAEYYLHNYTRHRARLTEAQERLTLLRESFDARAPNYAAPHTASGGHSDPVSSYVFLCITFEALTEKLTKYCEPVEALAEQIVRSRDYRAELWRAVMTLHYMNHMRLKDVAMHVRRHVSTIYRRREELVKMMIEKIR